MYWVLWGKSMKLTLNKGFFLNSKFKIQNSKFKIQNSKFQIPNSKLQTPKTQIPN